MCVYVCMRLVGFHYLMFDVNVTCVLRSIWRVGHKHRHFWDFRNKIICCNLKSGRKIKFIGLYVRYQWCIVWSKTFRVQKFVGEARHSIRDKRTSQFLKRNYTKIGTALGKGSFLMYLSLIKFLLDFHWRNRKWIDERWWHRFIISRFQVNRSESIQILNITEPLEDPARWEANVSEKKSRFDAQISSKSASEKCKWY